MLREIRQRMDSLKAGHYWKTPFVWEPSSSSHIEPSTLSFSTVSKDWLQQAIAQVMSASLDRYDQHAVAEFGDLDAARRLLAMATEQFVVPEDWWRVARDSMGAPVAFVLPVLFKGEHTWKDGCPEATIFYMGVLPGYRGKGHARKLLAEAVRICAANGCWRLFCDTATDNAPMVNAFRQLGFIEGKPWQRPFA